MFVGLLQLGDTNCVLGAVLPVRTDRQQQEGDDDEHRGEGQDEHQAADLRDLRRFFAEVGRQRHVADPRLHLGQARAVVVGDLLLQFVNELPVEVQCIAAVAMLLQEHGDVFPFAQQHEMLDIIQMPADRSVKDGVDHVEEQVSGRGDGLQRGAVEAIVPRSVIGLHVLVDSGQLGQVVFATQGVQECFLALDSLLNAQARRIRADGIVVRKVTPQAGG